MTKKYICIEVPCEINLRTSIKNMQDSLNIGHINAYTPESFVLNLETSGLRVLKFELADISWELKSFNKSTSKAFIHHVLRRTCLRIGQTFASRIFTYHAIALCERAPMLDIT